MKIFDIFGVQISLQIHNSYYYRSNIGGFLTIILILVSLAYLGYRIYISIMEYRPEVLTNALLIPNNNNNNRQLDFFNKTLLKDHVITLSFTGDDMIIRPLSLNSSIIQSVQETKSFTYNSTNTNIGSYSICNDNFSGHNKAYNNITNKNSIVNYCPNFNSFSTVVNNGNDFNSATNLKMNSINKINLCQDTAVCNNDNSNVKNKFIELEFTYPYNVFNLTNDNNNVGLQNDFISKSERVYYDDFINNIQHSKDLNINIVITKHYLITNENLFLDFIENTKHEYYEYDVSFSKGSTNNKIRDINYNSNSNVYNDPNYFNVNINYELNKIQYEHIRHIYPLMMPIMSSTVSVFIVLYLIAYGIVKMCTYGDLDQEIMNDIYFFDEKETDYERLKQQKNIINDGDFMFNNNNNNQSDNHNHKKEDEHNHNANNTETKLINKSNNNNNKSNNRIIDTNNVKIEVLDPVGKLEKETKQANTHNISEILNVRHHLKSYRLNFSSCGLCCFKFFCCCCANKNSKFRKKLYFSGKKLLNYDRDIRILLQRINKYDTIFALLLNKNQRRCIDLIKDRHVYLNTDANELIKTYHLLEKDREVSKESLAKFDTALKGLKSNTIDKNIVKMLEVFIEGIDN